MESLQNLTFSKIRKEWNIYEKEIKTNSTMYESLWNDWMEKFNVKNNIFFFNILKDFIENKDVEKIYGYDVQIKVKDKNTILIGGLSPDYRKDIHILCDNLGLHNESKKVNINGKKKKGKNKTIFIYKPPIWLWEYTEKDKNIESRNKSRLEKFERKQKRKEKITCDGCGKNGAETELFVSVYIEGTYCNLCLESLSDGDGCELGSHKFESVYY
jgi:hypothetical protein